MKQILSIILLLCSSAVLAADYYASSAAEVNKLCAEAKAGDRVIMRNGIYTDAVIKFDNNKGSEEHPFVFMAETPGKVFFEGNSTLSFGGAYVITEGFTWQNGGNGLGTKSVIEIKGTQNVFRNCAIINYNSELTVDNKWVSLYGKYNTVTQCLLKQKRNLGATLVVWLKDGEAAHHTISYNYFFQRINGPNADNGLESIRIGDSKTSFTNAHCVVAFNRFEECDGEIEIISNKSCFNSYLHNTFYNNNGGLTLRHGNNCYVAGNFFDGASKERSYGVRIIGEGHVVINNYFYHLRGAGREAFRSPLTVVNGLENTPINGYFQVRRAVIEGNIFVNNNTPAIRLGARSKREGMTIPPDTLLISNNIIYDDECLGNEVFEDVSGAGHLSIAGNMVMGKCLSASVNGFKSIKKGHRKGFVSISSDDGKILAAMDILSVSDATYDAGADEIPESIRSVLIKRYTITEANQVGPLWLR